MYGRLFFYISVVLLFFSCNQKLPQEGLTHVNPKEFQSLISNENVQLIDVRTEKEYIEGHIPGAINMDYFSTDFSEQISKLNKENPIFIYCRSGKRSLKSAIKFKEIGYVQIYNLEGGILDWKSYDLPIDKAK